jgi:hypothetical protein
VNENVPAIPSKEIPKDLVELIAMDIGKEVCAYVQVQYPDVWKSGNSGFKLSLRNKIYNEIMAALEITDDDAILTRLETRKSDRRKWIAAYKHIRETDWEAVRKADEQ